MNAPRARGPVASLCCALVSIACLPETPAEDTRSGRVLVIDLDAETELPGLYDAAESAAEHWSRQGRHLEVSWQGEELPGPNFVAYPVGLTDADDGLAAWAGSGVWIRRTIDGRPSRPSDELCGCLPDACWYNLAALMLHESGHVVGLGHSFDPGDPMFPGLSACLSD